MIEQKSLLEILDYINIDQDKNRFVCRVFFINNFDTYYNLINQLSDKADITIHLSDYCSGSDTIPDLNKLVSFLDDNRDKNVLIPHLGEYLRFGETIERNSSCLFNILNRQVHSKNRIWIPIFLGKDLFQSIVGQLDEERFDNALFEINEQPSDFKVVVYSKGFSSQKNIVTVDGIKAWFNLWDQNLVESGMSFSTRQIKQIHSSNGEYSIQIIADPFEYILSMMGDDNNKLNKEMGTQEEWASLVPYVFSGCSIASVITGLFNMLDFIPETIIGNWKNIDNIHKWAFLLWYRLGLNSESNYLSFSLMALSNYDDLMLNIECRIIDAIDNNNFEQWISERAELLHKLGYKAPSSEFWGEFNNLHDARIKIKILTGKTIDEKAKIIELVSELLKDGKTINDFKSLLQNKYPDLLYYLSNNAFVNNDLESYMSSYKHNKVADIFSLSLSKKATEINCLEFDTRGHILHQLKNDLPTPYFLWFDGMGIEWIDLLLFKVKQFTMPNIKPDVKIGTAILPTITKINMEKADPDTISEKKIDDLDALSHIKDKSECNYFLIIAKQLDLIERFAVKISGIIKNHPEYSIVITADHGMSRMAAKGFHATQAVNPPSLATVCNLGRYCELTVPSQFVSVSNTVKNLDGDIIAFSSHNHFTSSGNAPGEIHGGASPEEYLVPIIVFPAAQKGKKHVAQSVDYVIDSSTLFRDNNGVTTLIVKTLGKADELSVEINGSIINATTIDNLVWTTKIIGLNLDEDYIVRVCPNNIYSNRSECVHVKRKGLIVDDDF